MMFSLASKLASARNEGNFISALLSWMNLHRKWLQNFLSSACSVQTTFSAHGLCEFILPVNAARFRVVRVEERRGELFLDSCYRSESPHAEETQQLITCRGSHSQGINSHLRFQLTVQWSLTFSPVCGCFHLVLLTVTDWVRRRHAFRLSVHPV